MADLTYLEKTRLEKQFQMGGGYVLDFSNRTFQEFIAESVNRNIDDQKYNSGSGSKANRLRRFLKIESNHTVGKLIRDMAEYAQTVRNIDDSLIPECERIATRLLNSAPVAEIDAIQSPTDDRTFEALARSVRNSIEDSEPEQGLDRLHTFIVKFVRTVCTAHGISISKDKPLHSTFGEYVKYLKSEGLLESEMSERILKSSISTLESFNHVRNNQSFAHDNTILNYEESLLIFNHVCSSVRFIQSLELKMQQQTEAAAAAATEIDFGDDEIPF